MSGQSPMKSRNQYWNGIFTGVFIGGFFISAILLIFIRVQGLKIAINPEQLANIAQEKVQLQAAQDISILLDRFKRELPNRIAGHLDGLADLTISFGKSEVRLPPEVQEGIKTEFDRIIQEAIFNTLNDYDIKGYQEKLGKNAHEMVAKILRQEMIGKTYLVKTSRWLTVPVKIVGSANESLRIGI